MVCFVPIASPSEIAASDLDAVECVFQPSRPNVIVSNISATDIRSVSGIPACRTTVGISMKKSPASKAGCRALPLTRARVATDAPHTIAANHCSSPTNRSLPARTIDRTIGS